MAAPAGASALTEGIASPSSHTLTHGSPTRSQAAHVGLHEQIEGVASSRVTSNNGSEAEEESSKDSSPSSSSALKPQKRGARRRSLKRAGGRVHSVPRAVAMDLVGLTVAVPANVFGEPFDGEVSTRNGVTA